MTNLKLIRTLLLLLVPVVGAASCASTDPLTRTGLWRPNGSNDQNLRVMLVDQNDLVRGRGDPGSDGTEAAAAIQRLRSGKIKDISILSSQSGVTSGGS